LLNQLTEDSQIKYQRIPNLSIINIRKTSGWGIAEVRRGQDVPTSLAGIILLPGLAMTDRSEREEGTGFGEA